MNFFAKELTQMFGSTKIYQTPVVVGNNLLATLDEDLRVKIQFAGQSDSEVFIYDSIRATVISRTAGPIDTLTVRLSDILGYVEPKTSHAAGYCIRRSRSDLDNVRWETPISAEQKREVANAIISYIAAYHEPSSHTRRLPGSR